MYNYYINNERIKMKKTILLTAFCVTAVFAIDSTACKGCHGPDLSKAGIMGTASKNILTMSKADFIAAIDGYKAGTYGGAKKALMKGQANMIKDPAAFADEIGLK
jgi:cytochrome c